MEDNNIKIDEDELFKQQIEEIEKQPHSFNIHIGVPEVSMESFLKPSVEFAPAVDVHGGEGGVNSMTRAMGVIVLEETIKTLLESEDVKQAHTILKIMTTQKRIKREYGKDDESDTIINS